MPKSHPPYPPEFRRRMVELVRAGRKPEALPRSLSPRHSRSTTGLPRPTVTRGGAATDLTTEERRELVRLRRENRQLRMEREILSKAAAWFARETGSIPEKYSDS